MTQSKEKTFLDWLFGSSGTPEAPITVQVGGRQLRLEELQDEIERERTSSRAELDAARLSRTEAEAARVAGQAELERVNRELSAMNEALASGQAEIERLSRLVEEARAASVRDAEARRKLSGRCSTLQFEVDKLRSTLEAKSKRETELEQAAERASLERAELESATRAQLGARQEELEQRQKELSLARVDAERFHKELKRQQSTFLQASGRQQASLESERRAWAVWLGHVWNTLLYTLGPAAPLALETYLGELEPVGHAATTEAAEARLREFLAARAICRNVAIVEQQSELLLELEPGPALEGTAVGWVGILATRQLAMMLQRPLCTRELAQSGARLTVHTTSRVESAEPTALGAA
jgi:hypothetical protein